MLQLFRKELFILFTVHVLCEKSSICVYAFPFGFECGTWDLIILTPDHCLSIYYVFSVVYRVFRKLAYD